MNILSWNVADHNHIQKFSPNCIKYPEKFLERYQHSVNILMYYSSTQKVNIAFLSEVSQEYYEIFTEIIKNDAIIYNHYYDNIKKLLTIFFICENLEILSITPIEITDRKIDRMQIFQVEVRSEIYGNIKFDAINIHGWGDPSTRYNYLKKDLEYLSTRNSQQIICGDFNSTLSQVSTSSKENKNLQYFTFIDYRPTSYHKYILSGNNFIEKEEIYSKMDHLIITNIFSFSSLLIFPEDFTEYEYPYTCFPEENNEWPSDHTLLIYQSSQFRLNRVSTKTQTFPGREKKILVFKDPINK